MPFTVVQVLAPLRRAGLIIVVNFLLISVATRGLSAAFGIKAAYIAGITLGAVGAVGRWGLTAARMSRCAGLSLTVSAVIVLPAGMRFCYEAAGVVRGACDC